jgi:nicotinate-nucleotide pyrophosphorylase (carboxylating)
LEALSCGLTYRQARLSWRFAFLPFSPSLARVEDLNRSEVRNAVKIALLEDVGPGDATTAAVVLPQTTAVAVLRAREPLVVAGLAFAETAFRVVSRELLVKASVRDGKHAEAGEALLTVSGPAGALLTAERVALNFVQRLSGVATLAHRFVQAVEGTGATILDTRKTTPGWRRFEKYAVRCGGAKNHRFGLFDLVLIKDNHLVALRDALPNAVAAAVQRARLRYPHLKVEVEADTLEQVDQALEAGADFILLDNMPPEKLRVAVDRCRGRALTEASGGVNLRTVRAIAETGVNFISVGALTHSAPAVDIGLDFE